jgi:hypothetical protein
MPYGLVRPPVAEAVAASPNKSDSAIVQEMGVAHKTVSPARATAADAAAEKHIGKGGKADIAQLWAAKRIRGSLLH